MSDKRTDKEVLESLGRCDELISPEEVETDGLSFMMHTHAQVARDMVAKGDTDGDVLARWGKEVRRRWEEGKFFKLWQECKAQGKEPNAVFAEKGWEA
jgi:hypothetical protein